ncbi:hypothetical protein [Burkholderia stabilis]|uniref:hypothetical protein n=1 Tax=Burkholderia stabilis TaxID=95485 RepID=UPI001590912E|nr:hypothetical protein [Burkholderia stabilis]
MTRRVTDPHDRPRDLPGFNRLHHICQLWVDFLTADDESQKHKILFETVSHLMLCRSDGAEGEDVIRQVWSAVRKRGRVYQNGRRWAEAHDDGYCSLKHVSRPYPFSYTCACGHRAALFFPDINHIGEIVPCGQCREGVKISLDVEATERRESQDEVDDRLLVERINAGRDGGATSLGAYGETRPD